MTKSRVSLYLGLLFLLAGSVSAAEFRTNEVIVKYKENISRSRSEMNVLYDSIGVRDVRRFSGMMKGFEQLFLNDNVKVSDALAELSRAPSVEYAQPNYVLHALPVEFVSARQEGRVEPLGRCIFPGIPYPPGCDDGSNPRERPQLKPAPADVEPPVKDANIDKAYGLEKISAPAAWAIHRGSKDIIVADIDTGIDYNHEDLAFNIWRNPNPSDKNDVAGFDFIHNDGLPFDDHEHGTHTSGTIGAVGGNGLGISGVSQRVSLMGLKFLASDGSGTTADAIRAIDYAVTHGAKVLSNSWGGRSDPDNQALLEAIQRAKEKDVLFIAAAGNDGSDNDGSDPTYPAAFDIDNLISVAATDSNDKLASFSNYGKKTTHLAAPGVAIYSTVPDNKYANASGTSMACPHVAGAAALVWAKNPKWNYKQVRKALMKSVDQLPSLKEKTVSGGRINLQKALSISTEEVDSD